MALNIAGYSFEGPFDSADALQDRSGVYVIVDATSGSYEPIDCGESASVRSRVASHDRAPCWQQNAAGTLMVAVRYTPNLPQSSRRQIESIIRGQYRFPCGVP